LGDENFLCIQLSSKPANTPGLLARFNLHFSTYLARCAGGKAGLCRGYES
jgi:hypothetical protein